MSTLKVQEVCALMLLELSYCATFYPAVWRRHHHDIAQYIAQEENLRFVQSDLS